MNYYYEWLLNDWIIMNYNWTIWMIVNDFELLLKYWMMIMHYYWMIELLRIVVNYYIRFIVDLLERGGCWTESRKILTARPPRNRFNIQQYNQFGNVWLIRASLPRSFAYVNSKSTAPGKSNQINRIPTTTNNNPTTQQPNNNTHVINSIQRK